MAAFVDEGEAVRCAVALHRAMPEFRASQGDASNVKLKVGVYSGPCYSVNANNSLDYFGQSVNIAARLQGKAGAGEIVLTEEASKKALQHGWLAGSTPSAVFSAELKGVAGSLSMVRVLVDGFIARAAAAARAATSGQGRVLLELALQAAAVVALGRPVVRVGRGLGETLLGVREAAEASPQEWVACRSPRASSKSSTCCSSSTIPFPWPTSRPCFRPGYRPWSSA